MCFCFVFQTESYYVEQSGLELRDIGLFSASQVLGLRLALCAPLPLEKLLIMTIYYNMIIAGSGSPWKLR